MGREENFNDMLQVENNHIQDRDQNPVFLLSFFCVRAIFPYTNLWNSLNSILSSFINLCVCSFP